MPLGLTYTGHTPPISSASYVVTAPGQNKPKKTPVSKRFDRLIVMMTNCCSDRLASREFMAADHSLILVKCTEWLLGAQWHDMGFNCDGKCTGPELIKPAGSGAPVSGLQNHSASRMGCSPPDNSRDVGRGKAGKVAGSQHR